MGKFQNLDANESIFFARELEFVKSNTYDVLYPELKARKLLPVSNEAAPYADAIVYQQFDQVGVAKIIAGYQGPLPRADIKGKEFINPIKSLGCSYGYNIMEVRKSAALGKKLEQRKANSAKRAIAQKENDIAFLGDSDAGLSGFLNHSSISEITIPNDGSGSSKLWSTKTNAQILRDLHLMASRPVETTKGVEIPDTLLLPLTAFNLIASTPWSTSNDGKTILAVFLEQSQYIKQVDWLNELETAGAGNLRRMMSYKRDPMKLTLEIPQEFEQLDPQAVGLEFEIPCHSRIGGVLIYYPLGVSYGDAF